MGVSSAKLTRCYSEGLLMSLTGVTSCDFPYPSYSNAELNLSGSERSSFILSGNSIVRWSSDGIKTGRGFVSSGTGNLPTLDSSSDMNSSLPAVNFVSSSSQNLIYNGSKDDFKFLHDGSGSTVFIAFRVSAMDPPFSINLFSTTDGSSGTSSGVYCRLNSALTPAYLELVIEDGGGARVSYSSADLFSINTNYLVSYTFSNTECSVRLNGSEIDTPTIGGVNNNDPVDSLLHIGTRPDFDAYMEGEIGDLLFFDSVLSNSDISSIESTLMTKWGIT